jgi:hypothetical protein
MSTPMAATGTCAGNVNDNGPEILALATALEALNTQATLMDTAIKAIGLSLGAINTSLGRAVRGNIIPGPNFGAAVGVKSANDGYTYQVNAAVIQRRNQLSSATDQITMPPPMPGEDGI